MTPRFHIVPFSWDLCRELAPKLRQSDVDECTLSGMSVRGALAMGTLLGPSYIAMDGPYPVGIFGATFPGYIWGFCADLPYRAARAFLPMARPWVRRLMTETGHGRLVNRVPLASKVNAAWLAHSGCFEFIPAPDYPGSDQWLHFQTCLGEVEHV